MKKLLGLGGLIVLCGCLVRGPAVRLVVTNDVCLVSTCPGTIPPAPTTASSGLPFTMYVTALGASNARVKNLTTAVSFSSSDPLAILPSGFTFSPGDQGVRMFANGAVLRTPGVQTVTATDAAGVLAPGTLALTVTSSGDRLAVSNDPCLISACSGNPPSATSVAAGSSFNLYVAAFQQIGGNDAGPDANYPGTVTFTSTDPLASLPPTYTFVLADGGTKGFSGVALRTAGSQTITGTDPVNGLSGSVTLTVTEEASLSVPTLSTGTRAFLALALALTGLWLARLRR